MLYLIEILHQTTTGRASKRSTFCCILSKFYIKPQLRLGCVQCLDGCILSKFYIKPQRCAILAKLLPVVSYRNSTSNHNWLTTSPRPMVLYLIEILHQTTTAQLEMVILLLLYLIEILHQTTTVKTACVVSVSCILSKFYIKPQLNVKSLVPIACCILSKFYIKPQPDETSANDYLVVSYRNSTSNHNISAGGSSGSSLYLIEILHQTTTYPLVDRLVVLLYLIEILHQTTTIGQQRCAAWCCILSKFYIKPQPGLLRSAPRAGCILSKFYIKPQLFPMMRFGTRGCILSKFYIKPQLWRLLASSA